jgi:hypothetical protein
MNLPPLLFLVLGGVLLAFGCVRAFVWGFKAGRRARAEGNERGIRVARRHLLAGILWIGMGVFLGWEGVRLRQRLAARDASAPAEPENYRIIRTHPVSPSPSPEPETPVAPGVEASPDAR